MDKDKLLEEIIKSNDEMLRHFTNVSNDLLQSVQNHQSELFEINIRLDELYRTKNVYYPSTNSRKNVFSPLIKMNEKDERDSALTAQIDDLKLVKKTLEGKILEEETQIRAISEKLSTLTSAKKAINSLNTYIEELPDEDDTFDGFEFIEEEPSIPENQKHGTNILMLDAFDKTYIGTILDTKIKGDLITNSHRLEMLSYLVSSDPERARTTIKDISDNLKNTCSNIDYLLNHLKYDFDADQSVWLLLDDFITQKRDSHPECILESDIKCSDYDQKLSYEKTIALVNLLEIMFDNIYKHSNANQIKFRATIDEKNIDVYINDNGVGIDNSYYQKSPWYSSLHRAHEIIFLLDGKLSITGNKETGTTVAINFNK
ncbi:MAG: hypothetical protein K6C35_02660 [Eubacterium sp.]|nr:hypothetical protein [Eubacterium sp.]